MALTGKTIGELSLLQFLTNDTLFPVELSGDTYHIAYSAFTNSNYNEGTYDELYSFATGETLTAGSYYLMTDFQTCYDQPNYDVNGTPIATGNYKTGSTEPILLLAISTTGFSPTVYSTLHPQDKISYDITWNITEVTGGPAKGRITERIDQFNNRADYDFRAVQFIRYVGYFSEQFYNGKINLDGTTGQVTTAQSGTSFTTDFTVGDIFGVYSSGINGTASFQYYEISSIVSNVEMYVTGRTLANVSNVYYSAGIRLPNYMNPFQCNITGTTNDEFAEYYTFNDGNNYNTYLGNNIDYNIFILSNNVFLSGPYENNTFGGNVVGNTFNDVMNSNIVGPYCQYNIITNNFDGNIIGSYFQYNIIDCDMDSNQIGNYFQHNMLGDADGQDFDFNRIGSYFTNNFLTFNNSDFQNNNIGDSFNNNLIDSGFQNNTIVGDFSQNLIINQSFNDNFIGDNFYDNIIPNSFYSNSIGDDFNANTIYFDFRKNSILNGFNLNTIGGVDNLLTFENNQIMNNFKGNDIQGNFWSNQIKTDFKGNDIFEEFGYNNIGFGCVPNTFSGVTIHNNIGDYFEFNTCYGSFSYNTLGTDFRSNDIQDGFGFGGSYNQGNRIGNYFNNNTIGEYFYNNTIPDNFYNNIIGDYFQWNIVDTYVNNVDFTTNYGNISGITYNDLGTGTTNNTYTAIAGTTNGLGVNATFTIVVSGGTVTGVTINNAGELYVIGDTITILGTSIGGDTGVITTFSGNGIGITGVTGSYPNIFAQGTGSGENASFDVTVTSGVVSSVVLNQGGTGYLVGELLTISGDVFGSTEDITIIVESVYSDDVIITVTSISQNPSVYELYTCNIFKNSALSNRLSYYDGSDVLNIININE
jgi:hypothetical protein